MKNDKFCVSKSLAYLVALVVAVVAGFYVMNYANTSKVTTNTEAAGAKCRTETGVTGFWRKSDCPGGYSEYTGPGGTYTSNGVKYRCCLAKKADGSVGPDKATQNAKKQECINKKGKIAAPLAGGCSIYTGGYNVDGAGVVTCKVSTSADKIACSAGVGQPLKDSKAVLKEFCAGMKGDIVPYSTNVSPTNGNVTCRIYSGGYRYSRNPANLTDYTEMCLIENAKQINVGTKEAPSYKTRDCGVGRLLN